MINYYRCAGFSLLILLTPIGSAGLTSDEIRETINRTCIPSAEMKLAGIRLGDPRTLIESRLGTPSVRALTKRKTLLEYQGLTIRLHASRTQSILATSSIWSTPSGIRVNLSATEAGDILGFDLESLESPNSKSTSGYRVHGCIDSQEQMDVERFLRLALSPDRSIAAVEIFWVDP